MRICLALAIACLVAGPVAAQEAPDGAPSPAPPETPEEPLDDLARYRFPVGIGLGLGVGTILGAASSEAVSAPAVSRTSVEASVLVSYRGFELLAPELALRESLAGEFLRSTIDAGTRFFLGKGRITTSVRVSYVHIHQELLDDALTRLAASVVGSSRSIDHRNGFGAGIGLEFPRSITRREQLSRLRPFVNLEMYLTWNADGPVPHGAIGVSAGTWIGLGRLPEL